jgi:ubiquinone/menaquinone biosynthesis C-methylase UbiE
VSAWDRGARFYDWQLWLERAALDAAIDLARLGVDDRLLDLGTGTGALLRALARREPAPREAIGVDTSPQMLARVPLLPAGWELLRADAARLPFPDGSFNVLTATYLLHLLEPPRRAAVLTEARRVLRQGGRLVVVVTVAPPRSERLAGIIDRIPSAAWRRLGVMAGLRPLDPRADLEASGFAVCETRRVARGYPSLLVAAQPRGEDSNPAESSSPGADQRRG